MAGLRLRASGRERKLLEIFNAVSRRKAHHVAVRHDNLSVEFDGVGPDGNRFHVESGPRLTGVEATARWLAMKEKQMAAVTGDLSISIRDRIAKARDKAAKARAHIHGALDQIDGAAADTDAVATALEKEAAELQAALGIISNGAPEE